ncbi:ribose-phosphate pyrophosphokinase-like domain-containing protein, partial [Candidatus Omnitrophota bacterium]
MEWRVYLSAQLETDEDCNLREVALLHSLENNKDIAELWVIIKALRNAGIEVITLINTYEGYCRQDKVFKGGEGISALTMAKITDSLVETHMAFNIHYGESSGWIDFYGYQLYNLNAFVQVAEGLFGLFSKMVAEVGLNNLEEELKEHPLVLIAPDDGAEPYIREAARQLEHYIQVKYGLEVTIPCGFMDKVRVSDTKVSIPGYILKNPGRFLNFLSRAFKIRIKKYLKSVAGVDIKDCWVFIIDDETSHGSTLLAAVFALVRKLGFAWPRILTGVVHGKLGRGYQPFVSGVTGREIDIAMEEGRRIEPKSEYINADKEHMPPRVLVATRSVDLHGKLPEEFKVPIDALINYAVRRIMGREEASSPVNDDGAETGVLTPKELAAYINVVPYPAVWLRDKALEKMRDEGLDPGDRKNSKRWKKLCKELTPSVAEQLSDTEKYPLLYWAQGVDHMFYSCPVCDKNLVFEGEIAIVVNPGKLQVKGKPPYISIPMGGLLSRGPKKMTLTSLLLHFLEEHDLTEEPTRRKVDPLAIAAAHVDGTAVEAREIKGRSVDPAAWSEFLRPHLPALDALRQANGSSDSPVKTSFVKALKNITSEPGAKFIGSKAREELTRLNNDKIPEFLECRINRGENPRRALGQFLRDRDHNGTRLVVLKLVTDFEGRRVIQVVADQIKNIAENGEILLLEDFDWSREFKINLRLIFDSRSRSRRVIFDAIHVDNSLMDGQNDRATVLNNLLDSVRNLLASNGFGGFEATLYTADLLAAVHFFNNYGRRIDWSSESLLEINHDFVDKILNLHIDLGTAELDPVFLADLNDQGIETQVTRGRSRKLESARIKIGIRSSSDSLNQLRRAIDNKYLRPRMSRRAKAKLIGGALRRFLRSGRRRERVRRLQDERFTLKESFLVYLFYRFGFIMAQGDHTEAVRIAADVFSIREDATLDPIGIPLKGRIPLRASSPVDALARSRGSSSPVPSLDRILQLIKTPSAPARGFPESIEGFEEKIRETLEFLTERVENEDRSSDEERIKGLMEELIPVCYQLGYSMEGSIIRDLCFQILHPEEARPYKEALKEKLDGVESEAFVDKVLELLRRKGVEPKVNYRLKTIYSINLKQRSAMAFSAGSSDYLEGIYDLFGMQLWIDVPCGMSQLDALLEAASVFTGLPDDWVLYKLQNHFLNRLKNGQFRYPRIHLRYLVGDREIPVEIQIRIANHRFPFEGISYAKYKSYRKSQGRRTNIKLRLFNIFYSLEEQGREREYHELLLRLYHGEIDIEDLIEGVEPIVHDNDLKSTHGAYLLLDGGVKLPLEVVHEARRDKSNNRIVVTTIEAKDRLNLQRESKGYPSERMGLKSEAAIAADSPAKKAAQRRRQPGPLEHYLVRLGNRRKDDPEDYVAKAMGLTKKSLSGRRLILELGCGNTKDALAIAMRNRSMGVITTDKYTGSFTEYAGAWRERSLDAQVPPVRQNIVVLRARASILRHLPLMSLDAILLISPVIELMEGLSREMQRHRLLNRLKPNGEIVIKPYKGYDGSDWLTSYDGDNIFRSCGLRLSITNSLKWGVIVGARSDWFAQAPLYVWTMDGHSAGSSIELVRTRARDEIRNVKLFCLPQMKSSGLGDAGVMLNVARTIRKYYPNAAIKIYLSAWGYFQMQRIAFGRVRHDPLCIGRIMGFAGMTIAREFVYDGFEFLLLSSILSREEDKREGADLIITFDEELFDELFGRESLKTNSSSVRFRARLKIMLDDYNQRRFKAARPECFTYMMSGLSEHEPNAGLIFNPDVDQLYAQLGERDLRSLKLELIRELREASPEAFVGLEDEKLADSLWTTYYQRDLLDFFFAVLWRAKAEKPLADRDITVFAFRTSENDQIPEPEDGLRVVKIGYVQESLYTRLLLLSELPQAIAGAVSLANMVHIGTLTNRCWLYHSYNHFCGTVDMHLLRIMGEMKKRGMLSEEFSSVFTSLIESSTEQNGVVHTEEEISFAARLFTDEELQGEFMALNRYLFERFNSMLRIVDFIDREWVRKTAGPEASAGSPSAIIRNGKALLGGSPEFRFSRGELFRFSRRLPELGELERYMHDEIMVSIRRSCVPFISRNLVGEIENEEDVCNEIIRYLGPLVFNSLDALISRVRIQDESGYIGRVSTDFRLENERLVAELEDNGIGIGEGILEDLFRKKVTDKAPHHDRYRLGYVLFGGNGSACLILMRDLVDDYEHICVEVETKTAKGDARVKRFQDGRFNKIISGSRETQGTSFRMILPLNQAVATTLRTSDSPLNITQQASLNSITGLCLAPASSRSPVEDEDKTAERLMLGESMSRMINGGFRVYLSFLDDNDMIKFDIVYEGANIAYGQFNIKTLPDKLADLQFRILPFCLGRFDSILMALGIFRLLHSIFDIKIFRISNSQIDSGWLRTESMEYSPGRTLAFYIKKLGARLKDEEGARQRLGGYRFDQIMAKARGELKRDGRPVLLDDEDVSALRPELVIEWADLEELLKRRGRSSASPFDSEAADISSQIRQIIIESGIEQRAGKEIAGLSADTETKIQIVHDLVREATLVQDLGLRDKFIGFYRNWYAEFRPDSLDVAFPIIECRLISPML